MTFDDRAAALAPLGFSERQTRFLVMVALHSGFCLRRHYTAFADLQYGAGVRDFLDRLVARRPRCAIWGGGSAEPGGPSETVRRPDRLSR